MLSKEELLKKRYKVTGPYPRSPYNVGDLVEITPTGGSYLEIVTQEMSQWTDEIQDVEHYTHLDNIKAFPNLFQELPWYAERSVEDLPEYLIRNTADKKVVMAEMHNCDAKHGLGFLDITGRTKSYCNYMPATFDEYQEFKNNNL